MPVGENEIQCVTANDSDGREGEVVGDVAFVEDLFAGPFVDTGRARADKAELWSERAGSRVIGPVDGELAV